MIVLADVIEQLRARNAARPDLDCDPDADIEWAENIAAPARADDFASEIIFVICNSGMRYTVARAIFNKVMAEIRRPGGGSAWGVFRHTGKAAAIDAIWLARSSLFDRYKRAVDKLAWLAELPWIGEITKYHLAKNFGLQYAKPDVHLQRLASALATTPQRLCEDLAASSGYKVATIDTLLWRAAATGVLDTATGLVRKKKSPAEDPGGAESTSSPSS